MKIIILTAVVWLNHGASMEIKGTELVPQVIYVNNAIFLSGDGSSWTMAFKYLQDALDEAAMTASSINPVQIWVTRGNYYPDEDISGSSNGDRGAHFYLINQVEILGGFKGIETDPKQRNWVNNITILSGDIDQNDNLPQGDTLNAINVIKSTINNLVDSTAILDGFHIEAGRAIIEIGTALGGGLLISSSTPTLKNCVIRNNQAISGGGMYYSASKVFMENINFENNVCLDSFGRFSNGGGGMFINDAVGTLDNVDFSNNSCLNNLRMGGGLRVRSADLILDKCDFYANISLNDGGAIGTDVTATINIKNGIFDANHAYKYGSGIDTDKAIIYIEGCTFTNNISDVANTINSQSRLEVIDCVFENNISHSTSLGSGAIEHRDSFLLVDKCRFINNNGRNAGAIVLLSTGSANISNSSFEYNVATSDAAIKSYGDAEIFNCVFYKNAGSSATVGFQNDKVQSLSNCSFLDNNTSSSIIAYTGSSPSIANSILLGGSGIIGTPDTVHHCIIEGGFPNGTFILDTNPEFMYPDSSLLILKSCSPAIDAGDNSVNVALEDIAGNTRFYDATSSPPATIDIGAYEFIGEKTSPCCNAELTLSGSLTDPLYQAALSIICDGTVSGGNMVTFGAESIELQPNFEITGNTIFEANMNGCNE